MTDTTEPTTEVEDQEAPPPPDATTAMGEAYDRAIAAREAEIAGPPRDEQGRFVSTKESDDAEAPEAESKEAADEEQGAEGEAEQESEEAKVEEKEEADVEPPSNLPQSIKAVWKEMPESAREAVAKHQEEMGRKFTEQGRTLQAVQPIAERLNKAVKEYPQFLQMTPEQIADGAIQLAAVQKQLEEDPASTIMKIASEFGVSEHLRAHFNGQEPSEQSDYIAQLQKEIRDLKSTIEQGQGSLDERITAAIDERETASAVQAFADSAEHWADVEPHLPRFIEIVREQQPGASAQDTLKAAYDMAIYAIPDVRAKVTAAGKAAVKPDPERSEKAKRATSVNLKSTRTGKERPMSQQEAMAAAYDRAIQD